jgi:hypothetical protein
VCSGLMLLSPDIRRMREMARTLIIPIDWCESVELWAEDKCQVKVRWSKERGIVTEIVSGKFALDCCKEGEVDGIGECG